MPATALSTKELKPYPQTGEGQFQPGPFPPATDSREVESYKSLQASSIWPESLAGIRDIFVGLLIQF